MKKKIWNLNQNSPLTYSCNDKTINYVLFILHSVDDVYRLQKKKLRWQEIKWKKKCWTRIKMNFFLNLFSVILIWHWIEEQIKNRFQLTIRKKMKWNQTEISAKKKLDNVEDSNTTTYWQLNKTVKNKKHNPPNIDKYMRDTIYLLNWKKMAN